MIDIAGVSFRRSAVPVLTDITLAIPEGGIVAIVGPNGAGKSTLLHIVSGLLVPDSGTVHYAGRNIHAVREPERARILSLLTQSPGAVPRLTVRELVGFGRWPHHRGRPCRADETAVQDALDRFDLADLEDKLVETLSGGQKQRAFVATAYAQTTPWMLLDEPLAALDPKFTRDIMERLQTVTSDSGFRRSVAIVLYDLQIAVSHADFVVCLKNGALFRAGTRVETLTTEVLTSLYETPLEVSSLEGRPVVVAGR